MVRTPYRDKSGLQKGTWTPEEDRKLIDYVTRYGCWNWRQLPRFAGLARCGKSCRLRWMNYLRPDVKRGNFTAQEEETIIKLHAKLGNRWSAIAAELPGRTDNEIKNYWHTNLEKRTEQHSATHEKAKVSKSKNHSTIKSRQKRDSVPVINTEASHGTPPTSSQPSASESSCITRETTAASDEYLVLEQDGFTFLDTYNIEPEIANVWTEPYTADFSFVPNEIFTPLLTEPEYPYSIYDSELWGRE
ncbi:hypothetical protein L6164_018782 [Bauhinia variegata]|uniref:Uncharacterized protein n=1 Tax=Bauhinia variegata TaxID=167791 RepID=A0ACB9ND09_BAUVA|nr:hypothetical protein L6164_018782 [Bauhinia variegata]